MGKDKMLCPCRGVTRKDIEKAVRDGADTFKKVKKETGAATKCGKCEDDVRKAVKKARKALAEGE